MTARDIEYTIAIHNGVSEIETSTWNALVTGESPFLEHGFLSALEVTGCVGEESGWLPRILCAYSHSEDENGPEKLLGAVPLYVKTHSHGEFVFDWSWADAAQRAGIPYYPKAVVGIPFTPVTGARVLVHESVEQSNIIKKMLIEAALELASEAGLSSIHFNFIAADDVPVFEQYDFAIRTGIQYHWLNRGPSESSGAYGNFDEFLAAFRSKKRANLRRERTKLAQNGVTTEVYAGAAVEDVHLYQMFQYYFDTVQKFFYGRQYLNEDFFVELKQRLASRLHLVIASHEGKPFAGAFNLYKDQHLYGRYWGCVRDLRYAHFETCIYTPVEWCIENGTKFFEPGAGGDHKYDRGFWPTPTFSAHCIFHEGLHAAISDFSRRERLFMEQQISALRAQSPIAAKDHQ